MQEQQSKKSIESNDHVIHQETKQMDEVNETEQVDAVDPDSTQLDAQSTHVTQENVGQLNHLDKKSREMLHH